MNDLTVSTSGDWKCPRCNKWFALLEQTHDCVPPAISHKTRRVSVNIICTSGLGCDETTQCQIVDFNTGQPIKDAETGKELDLPFTLARVEIPGGGPAKTELHLVLTRLHFVGTLNLSDGVLTQMADFGIHLDQDPTS